MRNGRQTQQGLQVDHVVTPNQKVRHPRRADDFNGNCSGHSAQVARSGKPLRFLMRTIAFWAKKKIKPLANLWCKITLLPSKLRTQNEKRENNKS